jgi:hypothetical protein
MKLNIELGYDVVTSIHRDEIKEIEFSLEDFGNYIGENELSIRNEDDLKWVIADYLAYKELDFPVLKDNEDVDWDTFEVKEHSIDEIIPIVKHLIEA